MPNNSIATGPFILMIVQDHDSMPKIMVNFTGPFWPLLRGLLDIRPARLSLLTAMLLHGETHNTAWLQGGNDLPWWMFIERKAN